MGIRSYLPERPATRLLIYAFILANRSVHALNKSVEALIQDNEGRLGNCISCICEWGDASHVEAIAVTWPTNHFEPRQYFSFGDPRCSPRTVEMRVTFSGSEL
jgi:hypothetical protein